MASRIYKYIRSSNLLGASYDAENKKLYIQFTSGGEYVYNDVPAEVYEELLDASSAGSYFANNIKNVYDYSRI